MKRRRLGIFLTGVAVLMSLAVVFIGCDWWKDDDGGGGTKKVSKVVFVANTDDSSISVFKILDNGALLSIDNVALAEDSHPTNIALHPNGKFLYIVNSNAYQDSWGDNASISAYTYNSDNGAITEIEGSPFGWPLDESGITGSTIVNMAITPNGKYLYAGDVSNEEIMIFSINTSTGALTLEDEIATENDPQSVAISPSGKFLFAGLYDGYGIQTFVIGSDGSLTEATNSPYLLDGSYVWLAVTPNGKYLYGAGVNYGAAFSINGTTGELTGLGDGEVGTSADQPKSVVVSPDGKYLYSANFKSNSVAVFSILSDGIPDSDTVTSYPAGSQPKSVTVTRSGEYLYVANYGDGTVSAFCVTRSTGVLELIDTYEVGLGPKFIVALP